MTTNRPIAFILAVFVVIASIMGYTSHMNTVYQQGMKDAFEIAEDTPAADSHHGSPAYATNDRDYSLMNPYDHAACDRSLNGREAVSVAASRYDGYKIAVDNNGAGYDCNWNNLPFAGYYHLGCIGSSYGCGGESFHRKAKKK